MATPDLDAFAEQRPYLISLAYRMLGTMSDAEDLVQETFVRWNQATREEIRSPRAFLTTVLTRLAINHLDSARIRREEYVGSWLPEPVVTPEEIDPVELSESVTIAFLVLLERLTPLERAVFLLREVFAYSHAEIAGITGKTEEACRQAFHRAKKAMDERRPRFKPQPAAAERLMTEFRQAVQSGDIERLTELLHDDIKAYSDGGGIERAALNPIYGKDRVARFMLGVTRKRGGELEYQFALINAQPGTIGFREGKARTALVLDVEADRIRTIYIVTNPHKLESLPKERLK